MYEVTVKLSIGIVLLLISTKILVTLSEKLSVSLRISPLFVGLTLIAIGTSLPELAVSSIASAKQDVGLAMGNIVGSNIINILLILPLGILLGKLRVGEVKTQRSTLILLLVTAIFIASQAIPLGNTFWGILFIILAILLTLADYRWAVIGKKHEDMRRMSHFKKEKFTAGDLFLICISIIGIIAGGYLTVISTENLSIITGYSTTMLGLSLTAIATSLPELLTTIFSQKDNQEKITIGNIIGSNIYNLLLVGGISYLISPVTPIQPKDLITLMGTTLLFFLIIKYFSGQKIPRVVSAVLVLFLILYLYTLVS